MATPWKRQGDDIPYRHNPLTDNSDETIAELQFPLIKESREK